jgi:hypothetical protein
MAEESHKPRKYIQLHPQNHLNSDTLAAAQAFYVRCRQLGFVNGTVWEKISFDRMTRF